MNENSTPKRSRSAARNTPRSGMPYSLTLPLLVLFFLLGLGSGYLAWGRSQDSTSQAAVTDPNAAQPVARYEVSVDDDPAWGPADAPITIIEFSDFECPFCTQWSQEVWPAIQAKYPNQVRLVYRDFPLTSIHPNAAAAANAAACANEQAQFWEYHDLLFNGGQGLGRTAYEMYAADLGLDLPLFSACLDEGRYDAEVNADQQYAVQLGIQSTPTFFVNGIALIGAQPFEVFEQVIDQELAGKLIQ